MGIEQFPHEKSDEKIASRITPLSPEIRPSDEFVYWTRRMLLNAIAVTSEENSEEQGASEREVA